MASRIHALRGPVLSSTHNSRFPMSTNTPTYLKDALVILDGDKIIDFGPTERLKSRLSNTTQIRVHRECRIIKTIVTQ